MKDAILRYLATHHAAALDFWRRPGRQATDAEAPGASVEQLCDVAYSLHLAGLADEIAPDAGVAFADVLARHRLPGWRADDTGPSVGLSVHNCAYAFGTLNLLRDTHGDLFQRAVADRTFRPEELVDAGTARPKFPRWLAHHNWRVSHWLGGVPSLLWSAGHSALPDAARIRRLARASLEATDAWLEAGHGLIRLYRSSAVHRLFRTAYRLRHDPDLGDVGGVAHILWVNHVAGRPYIAADRVLARASDLFQRHRPFMETRPYCLDFDVVQIVRTGLEQTGAPADGNAPRAAEMLRDLEAFFASGLTADYGLHKLPGALATYHECAAICGQHDTPFGPVQDIIRRACWI